MAASAGHYNQKGQERLVMAGFHRRRVSISGYLVPITGAVCAAALLLWIFFPKPRGVYGRETIVVAASPMIVFSWDHRARSLIVMSLPANLHTEGTHGYGTYSLEAFWHLGEIDKKDGTVLSESVSEALGIPITLFVGPYAGMFDAAKDPFIIAKQTFSFANLWAYATGKLRTNIEPKLFFSYVWLMSVTKPKHVDIVDFARRPTDIAQDAELADGSRRLVADSARIDSAVKTMFEDDRVRGETVSVAVYNTTQMPSLGTRAARMLGHLGVGVVSVGNDPSPVETCVVRGNKDILKSMSARLITDVLGCSQKETTETDRADLVVRIGTSYAKRFVPN